MIKIENLKLTFQLNYSATLTTYASNIMTFECIHKSSVYQVSKKTNVPQGLSVALWHDQFAANAVPLTVNITITQLIKFFSSYAV